MAIKILTDSASDISQKEANKLGIYMIPMIINFGEEEFFDGVDLLPTDFYNKLIETDVMPKTSQISPFRFEEIFNELTQNGDDLIVITLSSKLSGTYESALLASKKFNGKVHVIDSLSAAIGERLLCYIALDLIKKGKEINEIVNVLNTSKKRLTVMAMVNTLEYLKRGGRISKTVAFAGELLSIKPVVAIVDGEVKLIGKAMGSKKANNLLNSLIKEKGGINFDMPYGIIWAGLDKTLLEKYLKDSSQIWQDYTDFVPSYIIGSTIGTHVGPGAIGVAFFSN